MDERAPLRVFLLTGYQASYEVIASLLEAHVHLTGVLFGGSQTRRLGWRQRLKNLSRFGKYKEPSRLLKKHRVPAHFIADYNGAEAEATIREARPDLLLLYGSKIIKPHILALPTVGTLNAHSALLPKYRGSASEFWMIRNNETQYAGVTIHWVTPGLDEGQIFLQQPLQAPPNITPSALRELSRPLAGKLFVEAIRSIQEGKLIRIPQDESQATKYKRPTPDELKAFYDTLS